METVATMSTGTVMPIGPNGEKRPTSVVQNAHRVFQIATGQAKEEYVDGRPWTKDEVVAMREAAKKKRKKRSPKRPA